jgi:thiol-disulfide isomerase/thioredoxin
MNDAALATPLLVTCLCAQWCGTCRDYTPVFEQAAAAFGGRCRFVLIDIEDDAALLDGIDIENFPTLLIARDAQPLFFGTVTPHPQTLLRLVEGALVGDLAPLPPDREVDALAARLALHGIANP